MNMRLLHLFLSRPYDLYSPETLGGLFKMTPARVLRDLKELEDFGFGFETVPNLGIRYVGGATRLCVDQIEWKLETKTIGRRIAVWRRTTSTNDLAARAATSRSNDGLVILAEEQTAGRGRRHRRWHAPPFSSILMSVLLFPPEPLRKPALLTSLAAVAVADVIIDVLQVPARIKWPNDVRVHGHKVCGILVETIARGRHGEQSAGGSKTRPQAPRAVVIGIGLNVNMVPSEFPDDLDQPATSLRVLRGHSLDRSMFARSIIVMLDYLYQLALSGKSDFPWGRCGRLADLIGERVIVERRGGNLRGKLLDLNPLEGLSLRLPSRKKILLPIDEVISVREI